MKTPGPGSPDILRVRKKRLQASFSSVLLQAMSQAHNSCINRLLCHKTVCTFLSKKERSGTFQTRIFPSNANSPNKSIKARTDCPLRERMGTKTRVEEAVSKYLFSHMELPIVYISTVYLLVLYYHVSITQNVGSYCDISTHACNIFWSCSYHIIFFMAFVFYR